MLPCRHRGSFGCLGLFWLAVLGGWFLPTPAWSQQPFDDLGNLIPADSQLAILASNAADALRRFDQTDPGKTLGLPAWQRYLQAMQQGRHPSTFHLRPWFGIDWSDLRTAPVPVACWLVRREPSMAILVLAVDARRDPELAKRLATRAADFWRESRGVAKVEQSGTRRQTSWQLPAGFGGSPRPALIERAGLLYFLAGPNGATGFDEDANRAPGGTLGKSAAYQSSIAQAAKGLPEQADVRLWVRPLPLAKGWKFTPSAAPPKPGRVPRDWLAAAERQGLDAIQGVAAVGRIAPAPGRTVDVAVSIPAQRPFRAAMQVASLVPGPWVDPPTTVPQSAVSWTLVYQDIQPWFKGFGYLFDEMVDPESPGSFKDVLDGILEDPEGPRISVEKEIIARLEPGVMQVHDHGGEKTSENPHGLRVAQRFRTREGDPLRAVFQRYFKGDDNVRQEQLGDATLWSTTSGHSLLFETGEEREVSFTCLAVGKDYLLLASEVAWLRSLVQAPAGLRPLTATPGFQAASAVLKSRPTPTDSYRGYMQLGRDWGMSYERVREGSKLAADSEPSVAQRLLEVMLIPSQPAGKGEILRQLPRWSDVPAKWGVGASAFGAIPSGFSGTWTWLPVN